eukprot:363504-Chlamydomonas_euryale.AAC.1
MSYERRFVRAVVRARRALKRQFGRPGTVVASVPAAVWQDGCTGGTRAGPAFERRAGRASV